MSALIRRLSWMALALVLVVLLISHRPLLQVAQSTWARVGVWFANGGALAPPEAEDGAREVEAETANAESPNMASYALTPGDFEPAELGAVPVQAAAGVEAPSIRLSPEAARSLMQERGRELDCELVLSATAPNALAKRERKWRWLPVHMAQAERQALKDAAGRLGRGCPRWKDDPDELKRRQAGRQAQLLAAVRADDLTARMTVVRPTTPQFVEQLPEAMYDAVLSGDPELIAQIGWADQSWRVSVHRSAPEDLIHRPFLWTLVACDLGLDCLPGSPTLDRHCLRDRGVCGSPNLDAAIRPLYPEILMTVLDEQRAELLRRIRSGQIAGLFDPPPPPPDGGP